MDAIVLDRAAYRDKVRGCWMGKNIGGTLGGPLECLRYTHALTFYEPVPDKAAPNDDLDLQLVWLHMLEQEGLDPSVRTFADYWSRYAYRYPWNEYGFCMRNLARGLLPPVSGCFENYFVDEMGSPIRSEIWACLHPGDPQAAARMAWKDSALDHAGGEGTCGEMFWAAVEAAAFVESDPMTLIRIGLNMIPLSSHLARSIREAVWCHRNGLSWGKARERIVSRFGHLQSCNAIPNHGFTIIGWLYGTGFGDRLCKAVNCGYDTDCTGATLGSLLGILGGMSGIPERWVAPVGNQIVLHPLTGDCAPPKTIDELTERTVALAERSVAGKAAIRFGDADAMPADLRSRLFANRLAREALAQEVHAAVERLDGTEVWLSYGGEPVLRPGEAREIAVCVADGKAHDVSLTAPSGWQVVDRGDGRFRLFTEGPVPGRNRIEVNVDGRPVPFTLLGPEEAGGFAAGANVPSCPKCGARVAACFCGKRESR